MHALDDVDAEICKGEFVALVGPSGCGKSTLLRIIGGLLNPSSGEVRLLPDQPDNTLCSIVFQEYSIFPWRTVLANVRFGLDAAGVPRREGNAQARDWIQRVGLDGFEDAYPSMLSGGMKQRVALARALVLDPELLLLDEPFAALDAQLRTVLQEELLSICQDLQSTVLLVTHSIEEAILLSDRILVMSASPGVIKREFQVPFDRPRAAEVRASREFSELEQEVWASLRSEVIAAEQPEEKS